MYTLMNTDKDSQQLNKKSFSGLQTIQKNGLKGRAHKVVLFCVEERHLVA